MKSVLLVLFSFTILILSALPSKADWNQANSVNMFYYHYAISHDKKHIALSGSESEISVVSTETGEVEYFLQECYLYDYNPWPLLAFSYDDKYLFTNSFYKWGLEKKELNKRIYNSSALCLDASPDGRFLAGCTCNDTSNYFVFLINPAYSKDSIKIKTPARVTDVHFTSDAKTLIYTCSNSSVYFLDVDSEKVVNEIRFDTIQTNCNFSLSHNDRYIILSDFHDDAHLLLQDSARYSNYLYDLKDNKMIQAWQAPLTTRTDFSSDDKLFVCPGDSSVEFRNTSDGSLAKEVKLKNYMATGVMSLGDEKLLLVNEKEKTMNMYDLKNNKILPMIPHNSDIVRVKFIDDNRLLTVESSKDYMAKYILIVQLFDCNTKKIIWRNSIPGYTPSDPIVSPDKKLTAVNFGLGLLFINNENGSYIADSIPVSYSYPAFAFSPDSKNIAVADTGRKIIIWDIVNNVKKSEYDLDSSVRMIYYDRTGDTIFAIGGTSIIDIKSLDLKTGKLNNVILNTVLKFEKVRGNPDRLSEDNSRLAFLTYYRVEILDLGKRDTVFSTPWQDTWSGNSLNISKDSKFLAVTYSDTVKIWNMETGALKKVIDLTFCPWVSSTSASWYNSGIESIDFSDDNKRVAMSNKFGVFVRDIDLLGVEDNAAIAEPLSFSISPNPTSDISHVDFNINEAGYIKLRLYSYTGILVQDYGETYFEPGSNTFQIDNSGYNSGLYFLELTIDGRKSVKPLVVIK